MCVSDVIAESFETISQPSIGRRCSDFESIRALESWRANARTWSATQREGVHGMRHIQSAV